MYILVFYRFQIQWWFVSGKTSIAIGLTLGIYASSTKYLVEETSNTNNITISTLTVKSVSHDDEGLYRCVVRIPRVPYPAWPKEDGFIHVTGILLKVLKDSISLQSNPALEEKVHSDVCYFKRAQIDYD